MEVNGQVINEMFDRIQLKNAKSGHYHFLSLEGLEQGEYLLNIDIDSQGSKTISIKVHEGKYWHDQFILKKNYLIESSVHKYGVVVDDIDCQVVEALQD